jgi:hypothetical protein
LRGAPRLAHDARSAPDDPREGACDVSISPELPMRLIRRTHAVVLTALVTTALASAAHADESGAFVIRLGSDTTSVERYTRSASRLEVDQIGRAPRVLRRHFTYDYANGALTRMTMIVTPPGSTTPTQTVEANVGPDSLRVRVQSGSGAPTNSSVAIPAGTPVVAMSSPWAVYEGEIMKFVRGKRDSARTAVFYIGASGTNTLVLSRLGRDSVLLTNDRLDVFHVRIDRDGRVLGVLPVAGTGKFGVERVAKLELDAFESAFTERERAGSGIGTLSPRDTARAETIFGASLWVDYGRPSKRGRAIFGNVVPYGEVWRTGANAATQFRTDKALDFGGTVLPAGFYTLWTLPSASGWKLIVNSETGQWGTAHKTEKDLFTIPMQVSTLSEPVERFTIRIEPSAEGGALVFEWDTVRATAAFKTQP